MNLPIPLPKITEQEKKLVIRVCTISGVLLLVLVAITIVLRMQTAPKPHSIAETATVDISAKLKERGALLSDLDLRAHIIAAQDAMRLQEYPRAIEHLLRILPVVKDPKPTLVTLGTAYLMDASYGNALAVFDKLLDLDATVDSLSPSISARRALTIFYAGNIEEGKRLIDECVLKFPDAAEGYCYRGQIACALCDTALAAESFLTAIKLSPRYIEPRYQQARFFMNQEKYTLARDSLLQIITYDPAYEKSYSRLGMVYYYLHDADMAKRSYETALILSPGDYNTWYNLGELYYSSFSNYDSALSCFKRTLSSAPNHTEANFKTGLILLSRDSVQEALPYLEKAVLAEINNVRYLLQCAVAYEEVDRKSDAKELYQRILSLDPLNDIALQKVRQLADDDSMTADPEASTEETTFSLKSPKPAMNK